MGKAWTMHCMDNANTFNKLIPLLPKDCFYMVIDFAGHGLSSNRPAGFPYHFFDYVTDVCRIVAELKWNRFSIMSHSLGGTVAGMGFHRGPGLNRQKKPNSLPTARDGRSRLEESNQLLVSKRKLIEGLLSFEAKQEHSSKVRGPEAALQRAKGGIFTGEFEDSRHFIQPLQKAYKSALKERFQLIEVAGNHFVHMNEPKIVAGIISAF